MPKKNPNSFSIPTGFEFEYQKYFSQAVDDD